MMKKLTIFLVCLFCAYNALIIHKPWSIQDPCDAVTNPKWPFAYSKEMPNSSWTKIEFKGRIASNLQNFGPNCSILGVERKCHRCENGVFQIQGMGNGTKWLPKNIPTITDVPFAINATSRYDYTNSRRICMFIDGEFCGLPYDSFNEHNYSSCKVRCWNTHQNEQNYSYLSMSQLASEFKALPYENETIVWGTKNDHSQSISKRVVAKFLNHPTDIAVDKLGNVFIVDHGNHCIKYYCNETKSETILAGTCSISGLKEGYGFDALFNKPHGVVTFYTEDGNLVVVVTDSGNHRLRKLSQIKSEDCCWKSENIFVDTFSGRYGMSPKSGFRDGNLVDSLFNFPMGIDVDLSAGISLVVADSDNHLVRRVLLNGDSYTIAGSLTGKKPPCEFPCQVGIPGTLDSSLMKSKFHFPHDVSVNNAGTIFVSDGNRVRRIVVIEDSVTTFVGQLSSGTHHRQTVHESFQEINGLTILNRRNSLFFSETSTGNVFIVAPPEFFAITATCQNTLSELYRSKGCEQTSTTETRERLLPRLKGNHFYGWKQRNEINGWFNRYASELQFDGLDVRCTGVPPPGRGLQTGNISAGVHKGTLAESFLLDENVHAGDALYIKCTNSCSYGICQSARIQSINLSSVFQVVIEKSYISKRFLNYSVVNMAPDILFQPIRIVESNAPNTLPLGLTLNRFNEEDRTLYVTDMSEGVVFAMSPQCRFACQNGGECVDWNLCTCKYGWKSFDCTIPVCTTISQRHICVGPDEADCAPGYTNFPNCDQATCVQDCINGYCFQPDTCLCEEGWFGVNCSVPVCSQTCGNGGNCTAPNTCSCPEEWNGHDCRKPVCFQGCLNGNCVAPNTCQCNPQWTGFSCEEPVCHQGFFVASDKSYISYLPYNLQEWCLEVNTFDCNQSAKGFNDANFRLDPFKLVSLENRSINGFELNFDHGKIFTTHSMNVVKLELSSIMSSYFPLEFEIDQVTENRLFQSIKLFRVKELQYSNLSDRQIAWAQMRYIPNGQYQCANHGRCVAPDVCECSEGWIGFDCRIPVCKQGYFERNNGNGEVLFHAITNTLSSAYIQPQNEYFPGQGAYQCSIRLVTAWENQYYVHDHPNYVSGYMDEHVGGWEEIGYWKGMNWPHVHYRIPGKGNYTARGWEREGYWKAVDYSPMTNESSWRKGNCTLEYQRKCESNILNDHFLVSGSVPDTQMAYKPGYNTSNRGMSFSFQWINGLGECVDTVLKGCYNNGTCIAPNVCECAPGYTGDDCSVPICQQSCSRDPHDPGVMSRSGLLIFKQGTGNCTSPNTCTCEKGWEGHDCSIPICAQECKNNGECVLPDTCQCWRWDNNFEEHRSAATWSKYRDNIGKPQKTGWTGFDCSTPICTQATSFIPIEKGIGTIRLGGYGMILFGSEPHSNIWRPELEFPPYLPYVLTNTIPPQRQYMDAFRSYNEDIFHSTSVLEGEYRLCRMFGYRFCQQYPTALPFVDNWGLGDGEIVRNDGRSYQDGCKSGSNRFSDHDDTNPLDKKVATLCEVDLWEEGDYAAGRYIRINNDATAFYKSNEFSWQSHSNAFRGEGIYACENLGSCIAPDVCSCQDGYQGKDCSIPLCRHKQTNGEIVSCLNGGVCTKRDVCSCKQYKSRIKPSLNTGYNGTDCSIPICVQGFFDKSCREVGKGGEGCFRCKNGGTCVGPDTCECTEAWTGHDCSQPVCKVIVDEELRQELTFVDPNKIALFQNDACLSYRGQGKCIRPNICSCTCFEQPSLLPTGDWEFGPWIDSFNRKLPLGFTYGSGSCRAGFEGRKTDLGEFTTCHLRIYEPGWFEYYTKTFAWILGLSLTCSCWAYYESSRKDYRIKMQKRAAKKRKVKVEEPKFKKRRRREGNAEKKKRFNKKSA